MAKGSMRRAMTGDTTRAFLLLLSRTRASAVWDRVADRSAGRTWPDPSRPEKARNKENPRRHDDCGQECHLDGAPGSLDPDIRVPAPRRTLRSFRVRRRKEDR